MKYKYFNNYQKEHLYNVLCEEKHFTARQAEICIYIFMGYNLTQVSEKLKITLTCVKWHLMGLYKRLGIKNHIQLFWTIDLKDIITLERLKNPVDAS